MYIKNSNSKSQFDIDEELIFTILSHPLRRKILKELHFNAKLNFTTMNSWGIKPGTLYFHIKELNKLITQTDTKDYILTEEGSKICNWFLSGNGKPMVKKIDAFTIVLNPYYTKLENNSILRIGILILSFVALVFSFYTGVILIGSIIYPIYDTSNDITVLINIFGFIIEVLLVLLLSRFIGKAKLKVSKVSIYVTLSNFFSYVVIFILLIIPFIVKISVLLWFILVVISQIYSILVLSALLVIEGTINPERSLL
ncbi:MAG: helix-turn-helix domain-containing protein, partial [Candidatus Heimdallarchaeota archaeon]|nr:helix-turn-helix domain-containing protein [Candidatus Heimdallarchaeota archaeon]